MSDGTRRYEFGSAAEDHTVLLGLRASQVGVLTFGLAVAVLVVRARPTAAGFAAAAAFLLAVAAATFWPVRGRPIERWLPTLVRWGVRRLLGRQRHLSEAPLLGHTADGRSPQRPPDTLAGVRLLSVPVEEAGGRQVAVAEDRRRGIYVAVLAVRGRSFQLVDTPEKQRRLAAWGAILTGLARTSSPIHRIQWIERTVPDDGDGIARYADESATLDADDDAVVSYRQLIDDVGQATPRQEAYVAVAVCRHRARTAIRRAGGGPHGAVRVLLREVASLHRQLASADIAVDGVLTPRLLASALRNAFDPAPRIRQPEVDDDDGGDASALDAVWPLAGEAGWSTYRTADVWHATYWIAQWPRTPVGADFLVPLMLTTTGIRTVAVTMEPVSPNRAHREVEQALLKQTADAELRSRAGFMGSARRRRSQETVARREQELADGHADYRISGYVTVSARSRDDLEVRCGQVEQTAHQAALHLEPLYGQQDVAFTYTLPLARGLAGRP